MDEGAKTWKGKVRTSLTSTQPHQIWPLFKDFFNLCKYFPSLSTSYGIHGTNGEPGGIRYCLGSSFPPSKASRDQKMDGEHSIIRSWSKERLVAVDEEKMTLRYEIVESNIGFKSYVSKIRVSPRHDNDDGDDYGCVIEWCFTVDPVQGMRFEELLKKYEVGLHRMAKKMEDHIISNSSS